MSVFNGCIHPENPPSANELWCKRYLCGLFVMNILTFLFILSKTAGTGWNHEVKSIISISTSLFGFSLAITIFYIYYKNHIVHFLLKILPSLIVTMLLIAIVTELTGGIGIIIWLAASLYVNKNMFQLLKKYKKYVAYVALCYLIPAVGSHINQSLQSSHIFYMFSIWPALIALIQSMLLLCVLGHFILQEIRDNHKTFLEVIRIMTLLPVYFAYICMGLITVIPVPFFSRKSLFGEDGYDCLANY